MTTGYTSVTINGIEYVNREDFCNNLIRMFQQERGYAESENEKLIWDLAIKEVRSRQGANSHIDIVTEPLQLCEQE